MGSQRTRGSRRARRQRERMRDVWREQGMEEGRTRTEGPAAGTGVTGVVTRLVLLDAGKLKTTRHTVSGRNHTRLITDILRNTRGHELALPLSVHCATE
eukprot:1722081-Rhodomonas_salina.2